MQDRRVPPYWSEKEVFEAPALDSVVAVEAYLKKLPPGSSIMWRDLPPSKAIIYPPRTTRDRITEFAKQRGLHIEIWPTIVE
jgi:hypothetical protein